MAEDITRVVEVNTSASIQTVRELQDEVNKLQTSLGKLKEGTVEYTAAQTQAAQKQQELNDAMEISAKDEAAQLKSMQELRAIIDDNTGSFGFLVARMQELKVGIDATNARIKQITKDYGEGRMSVDDYNKELQENLEELQKLKTEQGDVRSSLNVSTKAILAAKGSYVEMSQTLGQLRTAYRQLNKEQRESAVGADMLAQINALDAELKSVDASMGNFQRSVGGYEEALKQVLPPQAGLLVDLGKLSVEGGGIPSLFKGIGNSIAGMAKAAIAFIATPLGATLTALAAAGAAAFALFNARNKEIERQAESSAKALEKQRRQMESMDTETAREVELLRAEGKEQEARLKERQAITDAMYRAQEAADVYRQKYARMSNKEKEANKETLQGYLDVEKARQDAWAEAVHDDEVRRRAEITAERDKNAKLAEERRKAAAERKNAAIEANAELQNTIAMMNAELGAGTEEGDVALEQEKYRQELEAFNMMVTEKGITEVNAMAYREALVAEHEARIADIRQTYRDAEFNALMTELDKEMAAEFKSGQQILAQEKKNSAEKEKIEKLKRDTTLNVASSTLSSLSTILGQETAAGKAAAVASATIDTYKAANSAYAALAGIPIVGPGLGAAAAAAAIVAGIANVKQILSTSTDGAGASVANSSASPATPAIVTPPAVIQEVPIVRSLTGASEEERLNQMVSDQRVYLVYSDVEQAGRQVRVQQSETSF
ncbi:hypothetical protein [Alistipes senegalensis]|uniref:hypothetical protein n=1 Tax=Alistipes senegalensis TaxID=1288121 RepID=UPI0018A95584|nr:hypothetical protein [Alistipes senegalensis]